MFGTSGIRGAVGSTITASLALDLGRAVASEGYETVVVGRDSRESGRVFVDALSAGARECGADVVTLGLASTPTVARAIETFDADVGVSVTASHNPATDNGFKLWNPSGQAFVATQRDAIESRLTDGEFDFADWDGHGTETTRDDAVTHHAAALESAVDIDTELDVIVDVGNGAGQVTATALTNLGCHVETLNAQPDGSFPARPSEPTAETCARLTEVVAATDADLGIAHDGDADRMMAVSEDGEFLSGDALLALFARHAIDKDHQKIAAPLNTSLAVDDYIDPVGGVIERTKVGDVYVAETLSGPGFAFGGEPSGAWIWPDQTRCPDGPLAACTLAALVSEAGPLSSLLADFEAYPIRRESIETDQKEATMDRVEERVLAEYDDVETIDGVRVAFEDGWFLVRASGTQPLVRVTAEARDADRADELLEAARSLLD
ncbi:phosphoglucosamine mutase [Haloferax elongans ATCC BAA-1513]|uniref:Phosphoglucosamine mutase n=1 Tax=Haloferax elongans ATCC BAA-1513 TaxID=1230453 RepID=M0HJL4_HALEO|nr:phosphoglucosamine mutase [Haloferax elongans]ELZ84740.1 phosphoglucosamine mutase [Haloferax elongans ATCC BAA-1513]